MPLARPLVVALLAAAVPWSLAAVALEKGLPIVPFSETTELQIFGTRIVDFDAPEGGAITVSFSEADGRYLLVFLLDQFNFEMWLGNPYDWNVWPLAVASGPADEFTYRFEARGRYYVVVLHQEGDVIAELENPHMAPSHVTLVLAHDWLIPHFAGLGASLAFTGWMFFWWARRQAQRKLDREKQRFLLPGRRVYRRPLPRPPRPTPRPIDGAARRPLPRPPKPISSGRTGPAEGDPCTPTSDR